MDDPNKNISHAGLLVAVRATFAVSHTANPYDKLHRLLEIFEKFSINLRKTEGEGHSVASAFASIGASATFDSYFAAKAHAAIDRAVSHASQLGTDKKLRL
jgi:hypothetical protein